MTAKSIGHVFVNGVSRTGILLEYVNNCLTTNKSIYRKGDLMFSRRKMCKVLLAGALLLAPVGVAKAAEYSYNMYMESYGGTDSTSSRVKSIGGVAYTNISYVTTSAAPTRKIYARVRDNSTDAKATDVKNFTKETRGALYFTYKSGYGVMGNRYYLRMNVEDDVMQEFWVDGKWRP